MDQNNGDLKMTLLEMAAISLANEVEMCLRLGVPMTTNCINALSEFRKKQLTQGATLDTMYRNVQQTETTVISFEPKKHLKVIKNDEQ